MLTNNNGNNGSSIDHLRGSTSYDTTKDPRVKNKSDSSVYVVQLSCGGEEFENIGAFGTKEIAEKYCFNSGVGSEDEATYSITEFELQNTQSIQSNAISRCWIYTAKDLKDADKATANNKCEVHNCAENAMCVVNDIKEVACYEYRMFEIESTHYFCNAHCRDSITYDLKDW